MVEKDSFNPHFKSRYCSLAQAIKSTRVALAENGLSVLQLIVGTDVLVTILAHSSGQEVRFETKMFLPKNDPQGFGSALTYYRRYTYMACVGVAPDEDDDGNAATPQAPSRPAPQQAPQAQAPKAQESAKTDSTTYIVPIGKFKGFSLDAINRSDLHNYLEYINKTAAQAGKPIDGKMLEFVTEAKAFLFTK